MVLTVVLRRGVDCWIEIWCWLLYWDMMITVVLRHGVDCCTETWCWLLYVDMVITVLLRHGDHCCTETSWSPLYWDMVLTVVLRHGVDCCIKTWCWVVLRHGVDYCIQAWGWPFRPQWWLTTQRWCLLTEQTTPQASLSGTFLQTLPELVTPLKGHSFLCAAVHWCCQHPRKGLDINKSVKATSCQSKPWVKKKVPSQFTLFWFYLWWRKQSGRLWKKHTKQSELSATNLVPFMHQRDLRHNQLWQWLAEGCNQLWQWLEESCNQLWQWLVEGCKQLWQWLEDGCKQLWQWLEDGC